MNTSYIGYIIGVVLVIAAVLFLLSRSRRS